jgi:hypothetical protein
MFSSRSVGRLSRKTLQASRVNAALLSTAPAILRAAAVPVAQKHQLASQSSIANLGEEVTL